MKIKMKMLCMVVLMWFLSGLQMVYAIPVSPIVNDYGNVFPTLTEANLDVVISADPAPWYVAFDLLATADVKLGTLSFTSSNNGSGFNVTAIRLVTIDGDNVAFGTDTFDNPFLNPIDRLVSVDRLSAGQYALEVSGVGNRTQLSFGGTFDASDFRVRLQVTPPSTIPVPAAVWLFASGLVGLTGVGRRKYRRFK